MLSHLMETLLLVLVASGRNVESSTGTVAGNNGKRTAKSTTHKKLFLPTLNVCWSRKSLSLVLFVISRMGGKSNKFNYHCRIRLWHSQISRRACAFSSSRRTTGEKGFQSNSLRLSILIPSEKRKQLLRNCSLGSERSARRKWNLLRFWKEFL